MNAHEIRRRFLAYFQAREHEVVPSSSLIPHNDPTLFFVNAGMVQFKDTFTGAETRAIPRATTVQKCLRVSGKHNDLENVGRTPRHHTLFEMLGNFSFGDYFKAQAIPMAWDLLTSDLGIDGDRLWVTVFDDDDEAFEIWRDAVGVPAARIQRLGAKENFWSMGDTGPCGPCSEIHYDHGPSVNDCALGPAHDDNRYVEIWNLVFMQFEQLASGERLNLPSPSIDTGSGLERIAAVLQGVYSNYDTDVFRNLIARAAESAGRAYEPATEDGVAMRVISDHARAAAFLIGDGVMPSNEARGYVLRRIMRRAIRFGVKLGIDKPFFHNITDQVIQDFGDAYPELTTRRTFIDEVVRSEEERFRTTLDKGLRLLGAEIGKLSTGADVSGDVAFQLADTFGFPVDLTRQIAEEHGMGVDESGFQARLEEQRARGRAAWKGSGEQAVDALWRQLKDELGEGAAFTGYDSTSGAARVRALFRTSISDGDTTYERVEELGAGQAGIVLLDTTPFYAESGGQVGDTGTLEGIGARFDVSDTQLRAGLRVHEGTLATGTLSVGAQVETHVDATSRDATRRNHTATHLLHAALREVLGEHVTQKGSLVGPNRLRFDFSHHKRVTEEELEAIETRVNQKVLENTALETSLENLDDAMARGAMALFGEKYDEAVRVVTVPGFSVELCGGTHVARTGDIGLIRVTAESGIAAGVRRIEAQSGLGSLSVVREESGLLREAATSLKTSPQDLLGTIRKLQEERKALERSVKALETQVARSAAASILDSAEEIAGVKVLAARFDGDLREQADRLRDQLGTSLVVLLGADGDKVRLLAAATRDIAGKRIRAGDIIREIAPLVGGRGGGRPDIAQGGGTDPAGIDAALERARTLARELLA